MTSSPNQFDQHCPARPIARPGEEGYILVAVIFMLALLMIALAVAAPKVARSIQRDREVETMHRGKQYARAVKMFYKKFGTYPSNVDALVKTNDIRFLRQKYLDPMTGKDDWKPIQLGQNKAPTAMGFFGVPLNGAGAGGSLCGNALPSSTGGSSFGGSSGSGIGGGSSFGSSGGSSFGNSGGSFGSGGGSFGTASPMAGCPPTDASGSGSSTTNGTTDSSNNNGSTDTSGTNGSNGTQTNGGTASGSTTGSAFGTPNGQTGTTMGGLIMGFEPGSPKPSILTYKKKQKYNEWEFVYDPIAEQMMMQGGAAGGGLNPTGVGGGVNGSGGGIGGSGIGGGGIGGGGIGGGTTGGIGSGGTTTTPPQQ